MSHISSDIPDVHDRIHSDSRGSKVGRTLAKIALGMKESLGMFSKFAEKKSIDACLQLKILLFLIGSDQKVEIFLMEKNFDGNTVPNSSYNLNL
mmetsp:Transcript_15643/g.24331  ORF Transcript_15643/g.24331 Transcript_15643/m.24331 type:complete len:94 (+) Transcript_15643:129-410(+)